MPIHPSFNLEACGFRGWPVGRQAIRFPIKLPFRYEAGDDSGSGETVNISSRGVLLNTDGALILQARIELYIKWPVLLDNSTGLSLIVSGIVVRIEQRRAVVAIENHEFRTCVRPLLERFPKTQRANGPLQYPRLKLTRQWASPAGVDHEFGNIQRRKNERNEARWEGVFEAKFANPAYYDFRLPSHSSPNAGP